MPECCQKVLPGHFFNAVISLSLVQIIDFYASKQGLQQSGKSTTVILQLI